MDWPGISRWQSLYVLEGVLSRFCFHLSPMQYMLSLPPCELIIQDNLKESGELISFVCERVK